MNFLSFYYKKIKDIFRRPESAQKYVLFLGRHKRFRFQKWKRKVWKYFHRNTLKTIFVAFVMIVLIVVVVKESIVIKAETIKFYPNVCLGGWQHPENAEGHPELSEEASMEEFTDTNSAVLGNTVSQLFCSDFSGEIPKDAEMKTLLLKLSWSQGLDAPPPSVASSTVVVYPSDDVSSSIQKIIDATLSASLTMPPEDAAPLTAPSATEMPAGRGVVPQSEGLNRFEAVIPNIEDGSTTPVRPTTTAPIESVPVSFFKKLFTSAFAEEVQMVSEASDTAATSTPEITATTTDATTIEQATSDISASSEFLEILYTIDGTEWHSLGKVNKDDWAHEFKIPVTEWDDISKLQVSIQSLPSIDAPPKVYLDGMWLEAEYDKVEPQKNADNSPKEPHRKVIRSERVFKMSQDEFSADVDPSFEVYSSLQPDSEESGTTTVTTTARSHFWKFIEIAFAQGSPPLQVVKTELLDGNGRKAPIEPIVEESNGVRRVKIPRPGRQFSPGKYILHSEFSDGDTIYVTDQEFEWGVLVINVNKSVYVSGEEAYIQMAALDENGHTLCHEPLELSITDPAGSVKIFSTDDGGISFGEECGVDNVTNAPDYFLHYTASSTGAYLLTLSDKKTNHSIKSNFYVRTGDPFEIERVSATRINPFKAPSYTMNLIVKANQDWDGSITESVPAGFEVKVMDQKFESDISTEGDTTYITWDAKNVKAGDTFTLLYTYKAPKISPQIHLLGPLTFASGGNFIVRLFDNQPGDFKEGRQWQVASDAVNAKIRQEINILDEYLGAASGAYATSSEIIQIDTTQYTSPTYYFEVVASSSASITFVIELARTTGATSTTITIPTNTTSYGRFRSAAFTPTAGANDYVVRVGNASGATKGLLVARVIVLQGVATLTNTETQIEIGSATTSASNTATLPLQSPKYWYYDSSKWDGSPITYAEVTYQTGTQIASSTTYSTAGTFTYNESAAGVSYITVEAWGGGGGGGAAAVNGGGGGGGGAYARSTTTPTGSSHTLVVAAAVNSEVTGNDSTYDTTVVVADGGAASTGNPVGAGGTTANSTGQVEFTGGTGGAQNNADTGGGGGGSAGPGGNGTIGGAATASVGGGGGNANGVVGQQANGGNGSCPTGNGGSGTSAATGGNGGGGSDTSCTAGGSGGAPGGGGGGIDTNTATTNSGARGQIKITETYGQTGIALEEDNGSFGGWTFKTQIVANGAATSTSARVRSSSFVPISGRNYRLVASTTNSGVPYYIYNAKIIIDQTSATLLEPQYLLANTALAGGVNLQNFLTSWDSTEWNTSNTYIHDVNSNAASSVVEVDTSGGSQVTGSPVTVSTKRATSSAMTMPATGNLDMKATTNNGDVYASRILVQVNMTQYLTFSISGNSLSFGTLSSSAARYASSTAPGDPNDTSDAHTISVATNASSGYAVSVDGTTLTSGADTIATSSTAVASAPGTEQFGLRLIVNSGTGSATAPYASVNWAFDSATFPDQVASGSGDDVITIFGVRYIGNITANTEAGSYSTVLTYVTTATF